MFRRHATSEPAEPPAEPTDPSTPPRAGKGRPTPKRREAELARRQRVRGAANRREAARQARARARRQREQTRQAMQSGDERYFLKRDQGPVRRFIRNYVDSRRTIAEFFLPIIVAILLTNLIPVPQIQAFSMLAWLVAMILLIVDLAVLGVRLKREIRRRFPDDTSRGHLFYAVGRATQLRRFRLPKPIVEPGTLV